MTRMLEMPQQYPVACHTDNVGTGSTFVVIHGFKADGLQYVPLALEKGARTIVVAQGTIIPCDIQKKIEHASATLITVPDTRKALAQLSAQALGNPAQKLKIIGITGTKGKTTTAYLLEHILRTAGHKTALLSTVTNSINGISWRANLTTALPDYLQVFFDLCVKNGVEYVVMEVAAQALTMHRTDGIDFESALFTNFALEHTEFYATLDDYFHAKCLLLDQVKPGGTVILNTDDSALHDIVQRYPGCMTISMHDSTRSFHALVTGNPSQELSGTITLPDHTTVAVSCPSLMGSFNMYNILGAASLAFQSGVNPQALSAAISSFPPVPGRLERYELPNGALCFIDYAHNPLSYQQVLGSLRSMTDHLIVVFGAGGERGHDRRPLMGFLAASFADIAVITTDNPRSEDPKSIIADIIAGIEEQHKNKVVSILDRKEAIVKAYELSRKGSIIALLGKGPDEYQQIGSKKYPFSEKEIIQGLI